jgi:hypothetical protein
MTTPHTGEGERRESEASPDGHDPTLVTILIVTYLPHGAATYCGEDASCAMRNPTTRPSSGLTPTVYV